MDLRSLLLLLGALSLANATLHITPMTNNPGIYFEQWGKAELYSNEWKLIVYYDLEKLDEALTHANRYVTEMNQLCVQLQGKVSCDILCNGATSELNHLLMDVSQKYSLISIGASHRERRALISAVGMLSKSLFGTLSEEDAEYYNRQIEKLESNEKHLLSLVRNQTIILETTANIFNRSELAMENQLLAINSKLEVVRDLTNKINDLNSEQQLFIEIESLTSLITLIIMRYQNTIDEIIDLVSNANHGKPHPTIVTPNQLRAVLTKIRQDLPGGTKISSIVTNDILTLYHISSISATIRQQKVIYEFKIPLPYIENYHVYKIIPLPTNYKNHFIFIQPTTEYLIIDYNKEYYSSINTNDLSTCKSQDTTFLCPMIHPLFNSNSKLSTCEVHLLRRPDTLPPSCEVKQANISTIWLQLSTHNKWLFSTVRSYEVDEICKDDLTTYTLQGTAMVEISGSCYMKSKDLIIRAYSEQNTISHNFYIPPINISKFLANITLPAIYRPNPLAFVKFSSQDGLNIISERIKSLKNEENVPLLPLSSHDIHHYTLIYIILFLIVAVCLYRLFKCLKTGTKKTKNVKEIPETEESLPSSSQIPMKTEPLTCSGPKLVLTTGV